jgi:hypothetical protein
MTDRPVEPPLGIELPEMIQAASEIDDPMVYRIIDIQIAKQKALQQRASEIVQMLDDGAA